MLSSVGLFENDVELFHPEIEFSRGDPAPVLRAYRFIGVNGAPERLLERWEPQYALETVEHEHSMMSNWIRAQEWGSTIPGDCWRYIATSRRLKKARNRLRDIVRDIEEWNE